MIRNQNDQFLPQRLDPIICFLVMVYNQATDVIREITILYNIYFLVE